MALTRSKTPYEMPTAQRKLLHAKFQEYLSRKQLVLIEVPYDRPWRRAPRGKASSPIGVQEILHKLVNEALFQPLQNGGDRPPSFVTSGKYIRSTFHTSEGLPPIAREYFPPNLQEKKGILTARVRCAVPTDDSTQALLVKNGYQNPDPERDPKITILVEANVWYEQGETRLDYTIQLYQYRLTASGKKQKKASVA